MKLLSVGKVWVFCAVMFAFISALHPNPASATENLNSMFSWTVPSSYSFDDLQLGNGWNRTDRFKNRNPDGKTIFIEYVTVLFLTPESLGYSDMDTSNWLLVAAEARSRYPSFIFGASWYTNYNAPDVNWQNSGDTIFLGTLLGLDNTIDINTISHCDRYGGGYTNNGELVIGFSFEGEVIEPTPEPATLFLTGTGITLIVTRRRHRARRK